MCVLPLPSQKTSLDRNKCAGQCFRFYRQVRLSFRFRCAPPLSPRQPNWVPTTALFQALFSTRSSSSQSPQQAKCRTRKSPCRLPPAIPPRIPAARIVRLIHSFLPAFHLRHHRVPAHSPIAMFVPADSGYGTCSRNGLPCWPMLQPVSVSCLRSHFGKRRFSMVSNTRSLIGSSTTPLCTIRANVVFSSHRPDDMDLQSTMIQSRPRSTLPLAAQRRVLWLCCPLLPYIYHHLPYVPISKCRVCSPLTFSVTLFPLRVL